MDYYGEDRIRFFSKHPFPFYSKKRMDRILKFLRNMGFIFFGFQWAKIETIVSCHVSWIGMIITMLERQYQSKLIKKLKAMFPECMVLKNDANYIQGIPDLTILAPNDKWAVLETKRVEDAEHRPNQDYYIDKLNRMGYAAFIHPGNEKEILHEVQRALQPDRPARVSKRKQLPLAELRSGQTD